MVRDLVSVMLDSPIVQSTGGGSELRYFLGLEFTDAPPSLQVLFVESSRLGSGIQVPDWFVQAVVDAVDAYQATATTTEATANTWVLPASPTDGEKTADAFLSLPIDASLASSLHVESTSDTTRRAFFTAGRSGTISVIHWVEVGVFDPEGIYGQPADVVANTTDADGNQLIPDGTTLYEVINTGAVLHIAGVDEAGNVVEVIVERHDDTLPALSSITAETVQVWVVALLRHAQDEDW